MFPRAIRSWIPTRRVCVMTFSTQTWQTRSGKEWGQPEAFSYSVFSWSLRLQFCLFSIVVRTSNINLTNWSTYRWFPVLLELWESAKQCRFLRWVPTFSFVFPLQFHLVCFMKSVTISVENMKRRSFMCSEIHWIIRLVSIGNWFSKITRIIVRCCIPQMTLCQLGRKVNAISLSIRTFSFFREKNYWINLKQAWYKY